MQRIASLMALKGHKINDMSKFNRGLKITEQLELSPEEEKTINFKRLENGNLAWGVDDEGTAITDVELKLELSDEKAEFLKEVIEARIKDGISLMSSTDKAIVEVLMQIQDPSRME